MNARSPTMLYGIPPALGTGPLLGRGPLLGELLSKLDIAKRNQNSTLEAFLIRRIKEESGITVVQQKSPARGGEATSCDE